ncbi:MAG: hypothetical protein L6Q78_11085 [Bacteroidia bacterium]|nr:hypothetical protein [Bacteroidia bacterium]
MTEEQKIILRQAWGSFGESYQLNIAIEECAEVIQAINKVKRASDLNEKFNTINHLCEEIADLENMLYQIKANLGLEKIIELKRAQKIERLRFILEDKFNKQTS